MSVVRGAVEVHDGEAVYSVLASQSWPPGGVGAGPGAGRALLELAAPPLAPVVEGVNVPTDTGVEPQHKDIIPQFDRQLTAEPSDAGADAPGADADTSDAGADTSDAGNSARHIPARAPAVPTAKGRSFTARRLRSESQFTAAVTEYLAVADAHDAIWSPIALFEAAQIELERLADPQRAIALAERMVFEWPGNGLAAEARELRCRALRKLDRGEECDAALSGGKR